MADERLRLSAEVTDGFTGPLAKMQAALRSTAQTGTQAGKDLKRDFEGFHGALGKTTSALQGMTPVLSALGVGSLGAGLALSSITSALRSFSSGTQQLSIFSKETGLAVDQLRAFGALGERFGVSAEAMQSGVMKFSEQMSLLRRRYGETYSTLQAMNLGDLVEKLVAAPNMKDALDTAMDALSNIGDPVKRRKAAEQLFGGDQIAAVAGQLPGRVSEVLAEIERRQGQTTDAQVKAAQRFEESLSHLRENMDGLRTTALTPLLGEMNRLIALFTTPEATDAFKGQLAEIGKFARTTVQEFEAIVRVWGQVKDFIGLGDPSLNKEFRPGLDGGVLGAPSGARTKAQLEGRKFSVEQQRDFLDRNPSAPDYQRKRDRMTEELKRVGDELEKLRGSGAATVQQQSFTGPLGNGLGGLIQRASLGGGSIPPLYPNGGSSRGSGGGGAAVRGSGPLSGSDTDRDVGTPLGNGRGNARAARVGQMMAYAMDQLRREGVPEDQLRQSAAHLVGQATMESGLDPNKVHDGGTGYGIYGARDPRGWGNYRGARRSDMVRWLEKNGYARNSAEGQMRYMTHEAMNGGYSRTRRILMGRGSGDLDQDTNAITKEFESPSVINRRSGAVRSALRADVDKLSFAEPPGSGAGATTRAGDALMNRLGEARNPAPPPQQHSMTIELNGFPAGARARTSMDSLFKETTVSRGRQVDSI